MSFGEHRSGRGWLGALVAMLMAVSSTVRGGGWMVFQEGVSPYVLVTPEGASPSVVTAAEELLEYLRRLGGVRLASRCESEPLPAGARRVWLGWCSGVERMIGRRQADFGADESLVQVLSNGDLVLTGQGSRGPLYAVYDFLERACGVRWWSVEEESVPRRHQLSLPSDFRLTLKPGIAVRKAGGSQFSGDKAGLSATMRHNARSGNNGGALSAAYGGSAWEHVLCGLSHTMDRMVPDRAYFDSHRSYYASGETFGGSKPEYFALRGGRRLGAAEGQPCLTNPEVLEVAVRNAVNLIRRRGGVGCRVFWLTQNDNTNACECPRCLAAVRRLGNRSDLNIDFANRVADRLDRLFPGLQVETFAYQFTLEPPKTVRPRRNVRIRVCLIEADAAHPLTHPLNRRFYEALRGWCGLSDNIAVWHYITNFTNYAIVHPVFSTMAADIRLFRDLGIRDVYSQDCTLGGEMGWFGIYRGYLNAHLLRDPDLDLASFERDFFLGYYGAAGESLLAFQHWFERLAVASKLPMTCYQMDSAHWLPYSALVEGERHLLDAEAAVAGEPVLARRVAEIRLCYDATLLWRNENTVLARLGAGPPAVSREKVRRLFEGMERRLNAVRRTPGWFTLNSRIGMKPSAHMALLAGYLAPEGDRRQMPAELAAVPEEDLLVLPFGRYALSRGRKGVRDGKSPIGEAVRLPLSPHGWSMRIDLPAVGETDRWEVLFEARAPDGVALGADMGFSAGLYAFGTNLAEKTRTVFSGRDLTGKYHLYSLGKTDFRRDWQIYIGGIGSHSVPELLVGRFFLRRCAVGE